MTMQGISAIPHSLAASHTPVPLDDHEIAVDQDRPADTQCLMLAWTFALWLGVATPHLTGRGLQVAGRLRHQTESRREIVTKLARRMSAISTSACWIARAARAFSAIAGVSPRAAAAPATSTVLRNH